MIKAPEHFIESFINKGCRDRVSHEWHKNPEKLYYKVCHKPEELFFPEHSGKQCTIKSNDVCYVLAGIKVNEMLFSEAQKHIGTGNGVLIVTNTGSKYYSESESSKGRPYVSYAGG